MKIVNLKSVKTAIFCLFIIIIPKTWAAKLAVVIDDFGYRQHNEEQIIALSPNITVAVLPNSPNATRIATLAHNAGHDVIIHLPMAPISKQPLELNTLFPTMKADEIDNIVTNAIKRIPYAIGVNNHMGSLMTGDLAGMENVMRTLSRYDLFFLDSKTIGKTKAKEAAKIYNIPFVTRDIFLDDKQSENAINQQLDQAIKVARKNGSAIAIGHPHKTTINVLTYRLANLPADIELVKVQQLTTPNLSSVKNNTHPKQPPNNLLQAVVDKYHLRWKMVTSAQR